MYSIENKAIDGVRMFKKINIKSLYIVYLTFIVIMFVVFLQNKYLYQNYPFIFIGILFLVTGVLGLITKSIFLGRAIIVPYQSKSIVIKIINILITVAGVLFIIVNFYR